MKRFIRVPKISRLTIVAALILAVAPPGGSADADPAAVTRSDGLSRFSTFLVNNAYLAIRDGRLNDAESMIRRALQTQPQNARLLAIMAEIFEKQENWEEAEEMLTRLIAVDPQAIHLAQRGFIRLRLGRAEEAKVDFSASLDHNPDGELRRTVEAELALLSPVRPPVTETATAPAPADTASGSLARLEADRNWPGLEKAYSDMLADDPDNPALLAGRGFARMRQGEYAAAREDLTGALRRNPAPEARRNIEDALAQLEDEDALAHQAQQQRIWDLLQKAGRWSELDRHLSTMLREDADNASTLAGRGFARQRLNRFDGAREDFARALALEPGEESRLTIEAALRQLDDQERLALADARQRAWNDMGRRGDWSGLERELSAALADDPENPAFLAQRGYARQNLGRNDDARRDFEQALAGNPEPQARANIQAALRQMEADRRLAEADERQRRWNAMAERGEWQALERETTAALADDPDNPALLSQRGFARQNLRRDDEARQDFRQALANNPEPDARVNIQAALRQMDENERMAMLDARQKAWDRLSERGEWQELEKSVGIAIADDPDNPVLLAQRGFARQSLRRYPDARADFEKALANHPDPEASRTIRDALGQIAADERLAWRTAAAENITSLQTNEDWEGLERYLDEVITQDPGFAFALSSRGYLRVRQERFDEAAADFTAAIAAAEPGSDVADGARTALASAEREGFNKRTADRLEEAAKLIADEKYDDAQAVLDSLDRSRMETATAAAYSFYQAQLLWIDEQFEAAYALYESALPGLSTEFLQSECLWRMAEYNRKIENPVLAMKYAAEAAALLPDNGVRNSEVGYLFLAYEHDWEAIFYFERALQHMTPTPDQAGIYMDLGYAYQRQGDNPRLHCNIHRYVDLMAVKLEGQAPRYLKDDVENVYAARRVHADMTRRFGVYSGLYNYRRDNGDYASQQINDFYWQPWYQNGRYVQAYFQTIGTLSAKYSGEVYEPLSNTYSPYDQNTHWRETFQTVVGVRVDPSSSLNLVFSLEKAFKIGRLTENDVRVRVGHSWDKGLEWEPCERNWLYVTTFNEALYSLQHDNLTFTGEERLGRSFRMDPINQRLVATPFLGVSYGYQGRFITSSERWYAEAGPGIHFRKWYREDKYNAPRSYVDVVVQYRVGLTHKRENVLSLNVFHSF